MRDKNEKYYTPLDTAKKCIDKTFEIIGKDNITEIIEPSAGSGNFSLQIKDCIAYDILPEHDSIIKQDYLTLNIDYKKGRLIIGNPPFCSDVNDKKGNLITKKNPVFLRQFYKKSVQLSDYIAFILPISQLNNNIELYDFDLIYSEDLGIISYSNTYVHCCFNIYKRPFNGLNKKKVNKLNDVSIYTFCKGRKNYPPDKYDLCINGFGQLKICDNNYGSMRHYITINNNDLREQILYVLNNTDFKSLLPSKLNRTMNQHHLYKLLVDKVKGIK